MCVCNSKHHTPCVYDTSPTLVFAGQRGGPSRGTRALELKPCLVFPQWRFLGHNMLPFFVSTKLGRNMSRHWYPECWLELHFLLNPEPGENFFGAFRLTNSVMIKSSAGYYLCKIIQNEEFIWSVIGKLGSYSNHAVWHDGRQQQKWLFNGQ